MRRGSTVAGIFFFCSKNTYFSFASWWICYLKVDSWNRWIFEIPFSPCFDCIFCDTIVWWRYCSLGCRVLRWRQFPKSLFRINSLDKYAWAPGQTAAEDETIACLIGDIACWIPWVVRHWEGEFSSGLSTLMKTKVGPETLSCLFLVFWWGCNHPCSESCWDCRRDLEHSSITDKKKKKKSYNTAMGKHLIEKYKNHYSNLPE